jgi:uncharacterized protein (TIGR00725 family)
MDRTIIGVMGGWNCDQPTYGLAQRVGQLIAQRGAVLLTGGRGGVMEAAARGAQEAGGLTIGILKGTGRNESRPNRYIEVALRTGLGEARNYLNVTASDALIAIGGQWGTLSEIAIARKLRKPVILLRPTFDLSAAAETPPVADTPEQAVEMAFAAIGEG